MIRCDVPMPVQVDGEDIGDVDGGRDRRRARRADRPDVVPGRLSDVSRTPESPITLPAVAHAFTLPDLGEGLTEGEIARWLVREGDAVVENEPIVEIQTDKATVELGSPVDGVVLRILAPDGEIAAVGATLALIGAPGEQLLRSVATPPFEAPRARRADRGRRRLGAARGADASPPGARPLGRLRVDARGPARAAV